MATPMLRANGSRAKRAAACSMRGGSAPGVDIPAFLSHPPRNPAAHASPPPRRVKRAPGQIDLPPPGWHDGRSPRRRTPTRRRGAHECRQRSRAAEHPRAHEHPRRGPRRHAPAGHGHLLRRDAGDHEVAPRGHAEGVPDVGTCLHLRGQRARRLGGGAVQRALPRRDGARAGERPLRGGLGRHGADDGRQGRGAEGRPAARGEPRRGPPAPRGRREPRDQGHPGRADRHRLRRRQRPARDPPRHRRGPASRAPHGGRRRLARLHAVRDGRVGHRRGHGRLAEGPHDAARPRLRRHQRAGARRPPEGRPAHALLGLDVSPGRGALPEVRRHAAGAPALRRSGRRSTCCSRRGSSTRRGATRCSPRPPARR